MMMMTMRIMSHGDSDGIFWILFLGHCHALVLSTRMTVMKSIALEKRVICSVCVAIMVKHLLNAPLRLCIREVLKKTI